MSSDVKKESFDVGNSCECLTNCENFSLSSVAEFTGGLLQNIRLDIAISRKRNQKGNSTVPSSCLEGAYRRVHPVQVAFFDHRISWPRLKTNKANYEGRRKCDWLSASYDIETSFQFPGLLCPSDNQQTNVRGLFSGARTTGFQF